MVLLFLRGNGITHALAGPGNSADGLCHGQIEYSILGSNQKGYFVVERGFVE